MKQPEQKVATAKPIVQATQPKAETASVEKWLIIGLTVFVFLINVRTLNYSYTLDDPFFTKDNPNVSKGVSAISEFFTHAAYYGVFKNHDASYRPLMLTSFALEKDLFGFSPKSGHLINLLLFCLEIVVLFKLLRRIFREVSVYIPFFIVLLFSLHPIHTEVIASVKSRDEILGLLFGALSMLQAIKFIDEDKIKHLILAGVYFFCALLSKETPITFVVIVPMTIYFFREVPVARIVKATMPFVAVAAVYMMMRAAFIESDGQKVVILVNNNALMAATTYAEKLATLLFIQLKYLIILVFPHPLSYDYSFNQIPIIGFSSIKAIAALAVIGAMFGYALINFKKKDIFAYCILFYGLSVVITSNLLVEIGATMAERFIFSGSLAFCIAIVFLLARLLKTDVAKATFANSRTLFLVLGGVAVLYSAKTLAQNEIWTNNTTLYESGMETAPNSWRAQYLLAVEYTKQIPKETNQATKKDLFLKSIEHYNKSLAILPNNVDVYFLEAYAYDFMSGYEDSAIACYRKTMLLDPGRNDARINLGSMLLRKNSLDEAIQVLTVAVAKDSLNTGAISNLAAAYGNKGLFKDAERYYLTALRINPNQPPNVFQSMSNIYRFMGDSAQSQKYRQLLSAAMQRHAAEARGE